MNVWSFWFIYCSNVVTLYERANVLRFYASFYYYIKWLLDFFFYFNTKGCYTGGLKTFLSFIVVWPGERGNQGVELSLVPKVNCEKLDIWSISCLVILQINWKGTTKPKLYEKKNKKNNGIGGWWQFYFEVITCLYRWCHIYIVLLINLILPKKTSF